MTSERFTFAGSRGAELAARLDRPPGSVRATAMLAHCFTCGKDGLTAARLAAVLVERGFAVLRFDFTGLGDSSGEFGNAGFAGDVGDVVAAAGALRERGMAPGLLVGHSLGGTAVLAAAADIPEARAVATVGSPFSPAHLLRTLGRPEGFDADDTVEVAIADRPFRLSRGFFADLERHELGPRIRALGRALLVCHAPLDETVSIEEATRIFVAARHPKSFVGLDAADHLLTRREDAAFAGRMIAEWAARYVGSSDAIAEPAPATDGAGRVLVREAGTGRYAQVIRAGRHQLPADEPEAVGGDDSGPTPYDLLLSALGTCTAMTLRMYAERKGLALGRISVALDHARVHASDCAECEDRKGMVDRIERRIEVEGDIDPEMAAKLAEIADKCPVHRTLEAGPMVVTRVLS